MYSLFLYASILLVRSDTVSWCREQVKCLVLRSVYVLCDFLLAHILERLCLCAHLDQDLSSIFIYLFNKPQPRAIDCSALPHRQIKSENQTITAALDIQNGLTKTNLRHHFLFL